MELKPILSSLRRSPTGAILVALQIALALAIAVNSLYIITQRLERIGRDPGLDVANTFIVAFAPVGKRFNGEAAMREDIQTLRALPGVVAATTINAVPLSGGGSSTQYFSQPDQKGKSSPGNYFEVDEQGIDTLGVKLVEGRNFDASVVTKPARNSPGWVPEVILTRAVAEELFPGQPALGKTVYDGTGNPARVIGIIEKMHGSWVTWDKVDHVVLHPVIADEQQAVYMVRAKPGQRDAVMKAAEDKLSAVDNG
ncbi:MAG TPA: ABC transporter permease, partial [Steroidobacteraceae bacterium]